MLKLENFRLHLRATAALQFTMAALIAALVSPAAARETVLYTFQGGTDGGNPFANLIADSAGNLYGETSEGGTGNCLGSGLGCGTVFEIAPDGTETVLYAFTGGSDGDVAIGGLVRDKTGNLYGTTEFGGPGGSGTVFEVAPSGAETVLYAFTGGSDGEYPFGGVIKGAKGTLYGTTNSGGANGSGTVFELTKTNGGGYTETVLHSFGGTNDGKNPTAGLIKDSAGNLYGTTISGGASNRGTVFKVASDGTETVLYSFTGGSDGNGPRAGVIEDKAGNLYGDTTSGGTNSDGVVYKLAPDGTETALYSFAGGATDGRSPGASLFADSKGNLYGTTELGGAIDSGTVFKLAPDGTETLLYNFKGGSDGAHPFASLIKDTPDGKAHLFGTALDGGTGNCQGEGFIAGCGVVFEIKK